MASDGSDAGAGPLDPTHDASAAHPIEALRRDRTIIMAATAAAVVLVDQATKWWALQALDDGPIDIFWTLRLRLVFNTGAAFSLVGGLGPLLGLVAFVVAAALLWLGRGSGNRSTAVALGCIAGGALGNLGDRLFRDGDGFVGGAVVDFIDVQWWPVWNVADMAIVLGGAALVLVASRDR